MTDITYREEGEYLIPNIILDDGADDSSGEMIGRYGMMQENFLREHQHGTYTAMLLMGKLTDICGRSTGRRRRKWCCGKLCIGKVLCRN